MNLRSNASDSFAFSSASFIDSCTLSGSYDTTLGSASVDASSVTLTTSGTGDRYASTLSIDAYTADASRSFTKAGTGMLSVSEDDSWTMIRGDDDSSTPATMTLSAGSFNPGATLYLIGGVDSTSRAIFHHAGGTMIAPSTRSYVESYVQLEVANGLTSSYGDMLCSSDGTYLDVAGTGTCTVDELRIQEDGADAAITLTKTGSNGLAVEDLVIIAGASDTAHATLQLSAGSISVSDEFTMDATEDADAEARMIIDQAFSPNSVSLTGQDDAPDYNRECGLDVNAALTVTDTGSTSTIDSHFAGDVNVAIADNITADFKDLQYEASGTLTITLEGANAHFNTNTFRIMDPTDTFVTVRVRGGVMRAGTFRIDGQSNGATVSAESDGVIYTVGS
jgi:hypothetical protein